MHQRPIDLAHHGVAGHGLGTPATLAGAFDTLHAHGLLSPELRSQMRAMVGFRNIAMHAYEDIDPDLLQSIVDRHLPDLEAFAKVVVGWLDRDGGDTE